MKKFISDLSSSSPAPGGGGAAALVGAVGLALGTMVGNLTSGKKKYADVQEDIERLIERSVALTERLEGLISEDAAAFEPLAAAYRLPSGTDEEKKRKEEVMQAGLQGAARVPLEIARASVEALELLDEYALKGSRLAVSDAGCGAAFCGAAVRAAEYNVLINIRLMKDVKKRDCLAEELDSLVKKGAELEEKICSYVKEELSYE